MYNLKEIVDQIYYIGVNDRQKEAFENYLPLPNGVTYNSYVIMDEKVAVVDTVESHVSGTYFSNLEAVLQGRSVDYLIVHHMEPDHAGSIDLFVQRYPNIQIVTTYEDFHGVQLTDDALEASINLSRRYMMNKFLPDKALDLIDEACARESTMTQKLDNDDEYKTYEETLAKLQKKIEDSIEKQDYFGAAELKDKEEQIKTDMNKIRTSKNIPTHLRPIIDAKDIGNVLADKTGIPTHIVNEDEVSKLRRLAENLKTTIIGQDEAVDAVVKTLTRSRLSVITHKKPIGSFLFLGPSGVGKTYLAKLIAKDYFGDENALIRIDMSEFMEKYSVSKLIGSPAGYVGYDEGGGLTEAVRRKPYSVILFDEVEKAATDVLNILLQILDEGHLKDAKGRWIDFKNTIIIMTSNIGSEEFGKKQSRIGFANQDEKTSEKDFALVKERVLEEMKNFLSPELINRIDYKIVFQHLEKTTLAKILTSKLDTFLSTWKTHSDIALPKFTQKKIGEIVDKIYDPQYGARPVERYIQDEVEPELINKVLNKKEK
jgi:ATP-dependent Clp protease ATP-binding subunit ClpC